LGEVNGVYVSPRPRKRLRRRSSQAAIPETNESPPHATAISQKARACGLIASLKDPSRLFNFSLMGTRDEPSTFTRARRSTRLP